MTILSHSPRARMWGNALFYLITLAVVTAAVTLSSVRPSSESARLIQRTEAGAAVFTIDTQSGAITPDTTAAQDELLTFVRLSDGSVVSIAPMGLVKRVGSSTGPLTLLLASAVPANPRTPFAVWQEGARIAWRNPADGSLQIFADQNGAYQPVAVIPEIRPSSLAFTEQTGTLLAAVIDANATTVYRIDVGREPTTIATFTGLVTLLP
ncbi:hypothetical protein KGO06_01540 [Patescibacteria group bacterium]|nr:hypothetical protein [Patescibacteria group bacterium]